MANRTLSCKVLHVAKTTAQWASESSVVTKGMLCVEFTTDNKTRLKVGDGLKSFADLPYSDGNVDLTNYYTKSETDTAVSNAVTALGTIMTIKGVVSSFNNLPASNNSAGDVYFVPQNNPSTKDAYLEYVWVVPTSGTPAWEYIGKVEQTIDLSGYATITYVDTQIATLTASAHTHSNKTILDNTTASFTTDLKYILKYIILFIIGALVYMSIEIFWRGYTDISMGIVSGVSFIFMGLLNEWFDWDTPIWLQMFTSAIAITLLELISGTILNIYLKLNIWNYSNQWGNMYGQICPLFSFIWFWLSGVGIILDDCIRWIWFKEEKPRYKIF